MKSRQRLRRFLILGFLGILRPGPSAGEGRWQTLTYGAPAPLAPRASRFLVLDTGGSGGGFGQGDVRQHLLDVHFWDARLGWACGYGGLFKTTDGGMTWTRRKPRGGWYHIEMSAPEELWLLEGIHPGGMGKAFLWHSTDGGRTWSEVLKGKLGHYTDLYCRYGQCWVLCAGFTSYQSVDGGKTWKAQGFGGLLHGKLRLAIPGDVPNHGAYTVYAVGHYGSLLRVVKSEDGGRTWSVCPLPELPRHHAWKIFFSTSRKGWLGGPHGELLFTRDGGQTWARRDLPSEKDQRITDLWFSQTGHGFVAVQNSDLARRRQTLYETRDDGVNWWPVLGGMKTINRLFALGPRHLWAVGNVPNYVPNDLVAILKDAK